MLVNWRMSWLDPAVLRIRARTAREVSPTRSVGGIGMVSPAAIIHPGVTLGPGPDAQRCGLPGKG